VIASGILGGAYKAVVYFWAAGPQLVICLWLGYAACRRRRGKMLDWLIGGFAAALVPIVGVVVMIVLYRRAGRDAAHAEHAEADGGGGVESSPAANDEASPAANATPSPAGGATSPAAGAAPR